MKKITVKLTEDQVRWLISATQSEINYWQEQKDIASDFSWTGKQLAFGKRLLTKLVRLVR